MRRIDCTVKVAFDSCLRNAVHLGPLPNISIYDFNSTRSSWRLLFPLTVYKRHDSDKITSMKLTLGYNIRAVGAAPINYSRCKHISYISDTELTDGTEKTGSEFTLR